MNNRTEVFMKIGWWGMPLLLVTLFLTFEGIAQEDKIGQVAIEMIKSQMRLPKEAQIKFLEKKESPIPDFYSIKLAILLPDREIPIVVYVDKAGEKIILGSLLVKGENVTQKEAGIPRLRKLSTAQLEIQKSPLRGPSGAKITIVEFSNFECLFCQESWMKMKGWIEKYPKDIQYVFKHFPLNPKGRAFSLAEIAAAAQKISDEAFWVVHDFLFSTEGQILIQGDKNMVSLKIEQILKEKSYDVRLYQVALATGQGRKKVEEDIALGRKFLITGTPTIFINGEFVANPVTDQVFEKYF